MALVKGKCPTPTAKSSTDLEPEAPSLSQWNTSGGAVAGGIVVGILFSDVTSQVPITTYSSLTAYLVFAVALVCVSLWYALSVYPSLFGKNPKLSSNGAVSFLNGFFGGIIFGPLFSYNLTQGKKGVSNVVLAVLWVVLILLIFMA